MLNTDDNKTTDTDMGRVRGTFNRAIYKGWAFDHKYGVPIQRWGNVWPDYQGKTLGFRTCLGVCQVRTPPHV